MLNFPSMSKCRTLLGAAVLAVCATSACAVPQTFASKGRPGSMDDYLRITVARDCQNPKDDPYIKCSKQDITATDNKGKQFGKFDMSLVPKNADGTYKYNVSSVYVVDDDEGGGDVGRYFILVFVPQDSRDMIETPNGRTIQKFYEITTDATLKPLKDMVLAHGSSVKWMAAKRRNSQNLMKQKRIEVPLRIEKYVNVMENL